MKKLVIVLSLIMLSHLAFSQTPPPPNGGNDAGNGNTPVGGDAPIGGGLGILVSMGLAYGYGQYQKKQNQ